MRPCSRLPFYQASLGAKSAPAETAQAGGAAGATRRPQGTHGARLTFSKETEERAESAATAMSREDTQDRAAAEGGAESRPVPHREPAPLAAQVSFHTVLLPSTSSGCQHP